MPGGGGPPRPIPGGGPPIPGGGPIPASTNAKKVREGGTRGWGGAVRNPRMFVSKKAELTRQSRQPRCSG